MPLGGGRVAAQQNSSTILSPGLPGPRGEEDAGSRGEEGTMFDLRDLFQWERFITPSIIKVFYWLAVIITVVFGLSGILSGLALLVQAPLPGLLLIVSSVFGTLLAVIFVRIIAEFVLITFRINEHLGAIRNRGQM
jgi:hypothetical protein